jgi:hypothetical protein
MTHFCLNLNELIGYCTYFSPKESLNCAFRSVDVGNVVEAAVDNYVDMAEDTYLEKRTNFYLGKN